MNIATLLEMAASAGTDRTAVTSHEQGRTASQLLDEAGRLASWIIERGAERVVYLGENSLDLPRLVFAAAWAGVPFVPLNYRLADDELRARLDDLPRPLTVGGDGDGLRLGREVVAPGRLAHEIASHSPADRWEEDPDGIAALIHTSGTSARAKVVLLRHRHLAHYVVSTVEFQAARAGEVTLVSLPPYHVAGLANLLTSVYAGRTVAYLERFAPDAWLDAVERDGVTQAMIVPTMLARVLDELDRTGRTVPSSLRTLSYGGARMPRAVLERALVAFPATQFVGAYGLTETSSTVAVLTPRDHAAAAAGEPSAVARLESVGRPIPGVDVEIRDPFGEPVATGERGLVWVRGEQVSGEYGEQGSVLDDGWFCTRDAGWLDDHGYLFVEGRADDTIIRGGENIAPAEIEEALLGHPAISDAAVVGLPDDEWGQVIAAVVVADPADVSEQAVRDWARQRLRGSRTPDHVIIRDRLPYSSVGKLLRADVMAQALQAMPRAREGRAGAER